MVIGEGTTKETQPFLLHYNEMTLKKSKLAAKTMEDIYNGRATL
jgi:hypothetical protein